MDWGSWGSGGFGSGSGKHSHHKTPNGQHIHACSVHHSGFGTHGLVSHAFGNHGFFVKHKEHCPGCRRDRSFGGWGASRDGSAVLGLTSMFIGGKLAKKSLWDSYLKK